MADLSLSGLASGLDTATVISQLMAIERQGQTRVQYRQKNVQAQATGLKDVKTKLEALKSAAVALRDASTWKEGQSVESSDSARVARHPHGRGADRRLQRPRDAARRLRAEELQLDAADGGHHAHARRRRRRRPIRSRSTIGADAKIADVAAAINGRSGAPVYAAVVGGDKLVLSSRATGETVGLQRDGHRRSAPRRTPSPARTPSTTSTTIPS